MGYRGDQGADVVTSVARRGYRSNVSSAELAVRRVAGCLSSGKTRQGHWASVILRALRHEAFAILRMAAVLDSGALRPEAGIRSRAERRRYRTTAWSGRSGGSRAVAKPTEPSEHQQHRRWDRSWSWGLTRSWDVKTCRAEDNRGSRERRSGPQRHQSERSGLHQSGRSPTRAGGHHRWGGANTDDTPPWRCLR